MIALGIGSGVHQLEPWRASDINIVKGMAGLEVPGLRPTPVKVKDDVAGDCSPCHALSWPGRDG
jgi:hypothetical protein